ncbi:Nucleotide sugar epimerase [Thermogutta terrifontis]|uniref:Nucleotide sugar epimerase n=1 Tax=Thermogutta terrifontis TaxID=1331910 RepID=A0A286RDE2_9BACT|nr:NAD-dependent epimerase/dehydratase family protein [Thermogutta terrifontis]ASV73963.1 Nucleotide sugar epimerase [Thermogutta terrifontis]
MQEKVATMGERYLVTGCAGFIASRVCEMLLAQGHEVLGWDEINDAYDPRLKEWRLNNLKRFPQFRFEQVDISDEAQVENAFARAGKPALSAVINLAARAGVRASVRNPAVYYKANCTGTLVLLEFCRRYGISKFILASTSSLYGAHNPVPYREDADTNRPLSPYAASKKAAETLAFTYHYLHKLDVTVLRYFTVYGPAGRPDMSIFRFIRQIAEDEPIIVYGDGTQKRDFTYVDDIAAGTIAALRPLGYEIINLGGDRSVELNHVIRLISEKLGKQAKIERRPPHPADVRATWADIHKAKELLGWAPMVPIEEGIARCVNWYLTHRDTMRTISLGD